MANEDPDGGAYEKMMALFGAYDKTLALIKMLKTVYHNINRYFQQQIDIVDIQRFITENVCDMPDRPDIAAMQQNIQDYKHQEQLAQRQEEKQASLQNIKELYFSSERALSRMRLHQYLFIRAGKDIDENAILKFENERQDNSAMLAKLTKRYEIFESEVADLDKHLEQLISDRANSDVFREQERLEQQKTIISSERNRLLNELKITSQDVRLDAFQWIVCCYKLLAAINSDLDMSKLFEYSGQLRTELKKVESLSAEDFGRINISVFETAQRAMRVFKNQLDSSFYDFDKLLSSKKQEFDSNAAIIVKLQKGIKDYDSKLLHLHQLIAEYLNKKFGHNVEVHILADLLEIAEEKWQGAIEGYLNTQKFYLLVEPSYYQEALNAFNHAKRKAYICFEK